MASIFIKDYYTVPIGKVLSYIDYFNKQTRFLLGAVSVQIGASGGTRELFSVNYVLHYFRYNSVQTRCSLGTYSVLLVEPESYFQSIRSSTVSGVFRRGRRGRRGEAGEVGRQARQARQV